MLISSRIAIDGKEFFMYPSAFHRRRTPRRLFGVAVPLALLMTLVACTNPKDPDGSTDTIPESATLPIEETSPVTTPDTSSLETEAETPVESSPETIPETAPLTPEYINPSVYSKDHAGAKSETVLYAADYGVKGDGVTNDGPAISAAIRDAVEKQATLRFESGKTYLVTSADNHANIFASPFAFSGADGVTVDGGGSVFLCKPGLSFFAMMSSRDIRLSNMVFENSVPVYLVGTVQSVSGNKVTYSTDIEPFVEVYDYSSIPDAFSIEYNEGVQNRPHCFLSHMKKTASREVQVTYKTENHNYAVGDKVFLPNPGIGHVYGESIYLGFNQGAMTFENIEIRSAPSFIFAIKSNNCEMYFENVDLTAGQDCDREIQMVSWRDGYHCKDNRLPFHWSNCEADVLFDDVFNISSTLGYVTSVENEGKITVTNYEMYRAGGLVAFDCQVGDVVDVYNPDKGIFCGTATVRRIAQNSDGTVTLTVGYGEALQGVTVGCVVGNRETCAPGSTITDCRFTGTFRFLRNLRVERTTFDMLCTWIKVEGGVEGPLPGNIDFVDCTIRGGRMEFGTQKRKIAKAFGDIGFWNCTLENVDELIYGSVPLSKSDTWTEDALFTMVNRKMTIIPTEVTPNELDLQNTVTYDWTRYTMAVPGGQIQSVTSLPEDVRALLSTSAGFASSALVLTGTEAQTRFTLDGLSAAKLPAIHADGAYCVLTVDYVLASDMPVGSVGYTTTDGAVSLGEGVFANTDGVGRATWMYFGGDGHTGFYIDVPVGVTVYIGLIEITTASLSNPTDAQLENGHTFIWSDSKADPITIGNGQIMQIGDITDEAVRTALASAESGFTSGVVLKLNRTLGDFTAFTDPRYYTPGKTYHLSLSAYVAGKLPAGSKIYLLAMDDTAGNRILAEGLFTEEGLYRFETDWTVGKTGEKSLKFYINNTPTTFPDIYLGDFTVSVSPPQNPSGFLDRDDYHTLTAEELKAGYTFDFTEGNLLQTGHDAYANVGAIPKKTREFLMANGFGSTVYYCNQNFTLLSLPDDLTGGNRITVSMQIYDVKGNLATSGERGAFVMLHMQDGKQNSAEVHYTITPSGVNDRLFTLTFTSVPPGGTDDLLFYGLSTVEFYVGSVTVKRG